MGSHADTADADAIEAAQEAARGVFGRTEGHLRGTRHSTYWPNVASTGLLSLALPETAGGPGLDHPLPALSAVMTEAGRALGHRPLWSVLALGTLPMRDWFGDHHDVLQRIGLGSTITVGAFGEGPGADWTPTETSLRDLGEGFVLSGAKTSIWDADLADAALVSARAPDETICLTHLPLSREGVMIRPEPSTDGHGLCTIELRDVRVADHEWVRLGAGHEGLDLIRRRADLLMASAIVGAAATALDLTVEHVKARHQFGRPLGSFPQVGDRLADAFLLLDVARAALAQATLPLEPDAAVSAAAVIWTLRAASFVVDAAHHLHGGVGVTIDYPLQSFTRSIKLMSLTLGSEDAHLARLEASMGDGATDGSP